VENTTEFNRQLDEEYTNIRDFIIMHYKEGVREDSPFWIHCKHMDIPASLKHRQALFGQCGYVDRRQYGIYESVCIGQGLVPQVYDFKINALRSDAIASYLASMRDKIAATVANMPSAESYIDKLVASAVDNIGEAR
jgi:tryptophan halogenase